MKTENKRISFKRFLRIFSGVKIPWVLLVVTFLVGLLVTYVSMMMVFLTGDVIDASGNVANDQVVQYAVVMLAVVGLNVLVSLLGGVVSEKINLGLRKKLWGVMVYLPRKTYDEDKGENLVSRVTADCESASGIFAMTIQILTIVISVVMYVYEMFMMDIQLTLYMLLLIPVGALIGVVYGIVRYWIGSRSQATLSEATSYLVERTRNLNLIKISGMEQQEGSLGADRFQTQYVIDVKTGLADIFNLAINQALPMVAMAITFFSGAALVASGKMSAGTVVAFYTMAMSVGTVVSNLIDGFGSIRQSIGALDRVTQTLEIPTEKVDEGIELDVPDADIAFGGVRFAYGKNTVLEEITTMIPKKKCTVLIGENGSGKSTLFKLLERFYDPQAGQIRFGDNNIDQYSLHSWRNSFGYVSQDCSIIEGTIRSNITYGSNHPISDEELQQAIEMANLKELCDSLPEGVDSYVAIDGQNLSGGQRQCVAIARMIIHNPDYLMLDEATSNLDACSANMVHEALENLMKDRTTLMVAHDKATIDKADYVILLKDGKVAAAGERETLKAGNKEYQDFFNADNCSMC